jgi:hypothetical protein
MQPHVETLGRLGSSLCQRSLTDVGSEPCPHAQRDRLLPKADLMLPEQGGRVPADAIPAAPPSHTADENL